MFFAKLVDQPDDDAQSLILVVPQLWLCIGLGFGVFVRTIGLSDIGSDVTIPCRNLASLKLSFKERRMPGPNEML